MIFADLSMQLLPCRYVHAEDRHFEARCKIHYCKTCKKQFASWHPDSMKWWPPCVRRRLYNVLHVGRKSALARTIVDRAVREGPLGLANGHMASEMNERKVAHWRSLQCEYESWVSFERQRKQRGLAGSLAGTDTGPAEAFAGFDSRKFDGRWVTKDILQTVVGQFAACRMAGITLRIQHLHGKVWVSDDAFKRSMRVSGPAVMDNTLVRTCPPVILPSFSLLFHSTPATVLMIFNRYCH